MSRTKNALRNSGVGLFTQVVTLLLSFIMSSLFVRTLGGEFLGANGLFSNVIAILSFSELGIGSAIAFALYKPLFDGDKARIAAIMAFFSKVYTWVGIGILAMSLLLVPFLDLFVKGATIPHIKLYFFLFAANTALSYFLSYKRTLLIADQKSYITDMNGFYSKVIVSVLQFVALFYQSYLIYLIIQLIGTVIFNALITHQANKIYRDIFAMTPEKMSREDFNIIKKSTMGIMGQKIGAIVVRDTNNLLVSSFVGLFTTGVFSSYMVILNGVQMVISQLLNAVVASLGNLGAENDKQKLFMWLKRHIFLTWSIAYFSAIYLLTLSSPFMKIWLGNEYQFGMGIVAVMVVNFYISQTRMTFLSFVQAQGLFLKVGVKSIIEAILNFVLCLVLMVPLHLGVLGVMLGTTGVHILLNIWFEPLIVYRDGFKEKLPLQYFGFFALKMAYTFGVGFAINQLCDAIVGDGILGFIARFAIVTIGSVAGYLLVAAKNESFKFYMGYVRQMLMKVTRRVEVE